MARNLEPKCKQCRRVGEKLFLKGDKCFTVKCPIVRRNYAPGQHGQSGTGRLSGFGQQLREKQKAKKMYGLLERQFRNYYEKALRQTGNTGESIFRLLELRLDNAVYRLGFATSRDQARQLVNHGHIQVNGRRVDIPSSHVRIGDVISVQEASKKLPYFQELEKAIEKSTIPTWVSRDAKAMSGKIESIPTLEHFPTGIQMPLIIEYYSR
jgi:small subunit ribosomal protein S4